MDNTEVIPYTPAPQTIPIIQAPPVFKDPKAERSYVKHLNTQALIGETIGNPAVMIIASVLILENARARGTVGSLTAALAMTGCSVAALMKAAPPEAWNATGHVLGKVADKLPGGLWDVIF